MRRYLLLSTAAFFAATATHAATPDHAVPAPPPPPGERPLGPTDPTADIGTADLTPFNDQLVADNATLERLTNFEQRLGNQRIHAVKPALEIQHVSVPRRIYHWVKRRF